MPRGCPLPTAPGKGWWEHLAEACRKAGGAKTPGFQTHQGICTHISLGKSYNLSGHQLHSLPSGSDNPCPPNSPQLLMRNNEQGSERAVWGHWRENPPFLSTYYVSGFPPMRSSPPEAPLTGGAELPASSMPLQDCTLL